MKRKLCKLFCICAIAFSMMGCGASDKIEVPDLIRGDAPVHNNELIQIGIFMVALIGLCYQVFKGKRK